MVKQFRRSIISRYMKLTSHAPCSSGSLGLLIRKMRRPPAFSRGCQGQSSKTVGGASRGVGLPGVLRRWVTRPKPHIAVALHCHVLGRLFSSLRWPSLGDAQLLGFLPLHELRMMWSLQDQRTSFSPDANQILM